MYGKEVMLGRRSNRFAMADDIDDSFEMSDSHEMMLHANLIDMDMFLYHFIELLGCNL